MKLSNWLAVTVLVPRILLMDTTVTQDEALDLKISQSGDKIIYYDVEMELVEMPDYPCLIEIDESTSTDASAE